MKKILVTGGLGYIGSHTVVSLIEKGFTPVVIDNLSNSHIEIKKNIERITNQELICYNVDLLNYNQCISILKQEGDFLGVIHFAALKSVEESFNNPLEYYNTNVNGVLNLLKIIDELNISNFIFSSSCAVYGNVIQMPVNEQSQVIQPLTPYGLSKKIGEEILVNYTQLKKKKSISLRYFNPIGAHQSGMIGEYPKGKPNNLMPFITQTAIGLREELTIFGNNYNTPDGTCIRDYIHVCDLAEVHVIALESLIEKEESFVDYYNIGTGVGISTLDLLNTFQIINKVKIKYVFAERRLGDIPVVYGNAEKAQKFFNWKPKRSIEEAVQSAWKWEQFKQAFI